VVLLLVELTVKHGIVRTVKRGNQQYMTVISAIVAFIRLSPTVYLYSLLKSFVNLKMASSKSYVALYTGNSLYCAIIELFPKIISREAGNEIDK
jgi:hypothetical protein